MCASFIYTPIKIKTSFHGTSCDNEIAIKKNVRKILYVVLLTNTSISANCQALIAYENHI